jgi:predicted HTH transcriptional regulator
VPESDRKPHAFLGNSEEQESGNGGLRVYIRVNDKTVLASKEMVRILRSERSDTPPMRIAIGENERRLFRYLDENERITVRQFADLVNISDRRATRTLVALVRAGVLRIHTLERTDFFTMAFDLPA